MTAEDRDVWGMGALTIAQAVERFPFGRDRLFELMADGFVRWKVRDANGTRVLSWADLAAFVAGLPDGEATPRRE